MNNDPFLKLRIAVLMNSERIPFKKNAPSLHRIIGNYNGERGFKSPFLF